MGNSFLEKHESTLNYLMAISLFIVIIVTFFVIKANIELEKDKVAIVNDEPIYKVQLDQRREGMPSYMSNAYTDAMLLEEMIQDFLLIQIIEELKITVSEEEMQNGRKQFLEQSQMTEEQLQQIIELQGTTNKEFATMLKKQLLLNKLLERDVFEGLLVTNDEAFEYYETNLDLFTLPEHVEIRQFSMPLDFEDADVIINDAIRDMLRTDNLCEVVISKYPELENNCASFNVSRLSGAPEEFIEDIFAMRNNDVSLLQTEYGKHVVQRIAIHEENIGLFEELDDQIKDLILNEKKKIAYRDYLYDLRENSEIQNFIVDKYLDEMMEKHVVEEAEVACLRDRAVLYGAKWDSQTKNQLEILKKNNLTVQFIDCATSDSIEEQLAVCDEAEIKAYPTWYIDGSLHVGIKSFEELSIIANC